MSAMLALAQGLGKRFRIRVVRRSPLATLREGFSGTATHRDLWVLRDVSLRLERGDRLAVIGGNGCGKTTLLRMMAGIYRPSRGHLVIHGEPRILFRSGIGFTPELSVIDNAFLFGAVHGIERSVLRGQVEAALEFSELRELAHGPLKNLSVGQLRRLALSVFAESRGNFLMLDEALDNVDLEFRRRFEARFAQLLDPGKTFVMTSHDSDLLARFCRTAIWLADGTVHMAGPVEEVLRCYSECVERRT